MELATVDAGEQHSRQRQAAPSSRRPLAEMVTVGLMVLHVAAVGWLVAGGSLYIDDIRAQAYAAGRPIWPFVVESNQTHLAPGARTVDWFMATYAPLEHWPAVLVTLAIAALFAWSSASAPPPGRREPRRAPARPVVGAVRRVGHPHVRLVPPGPHDDAPAGPGPAGHQPHPRPRPHRSASALAAGRGLPRRGATFSERALAVPVVVFAILLVTRNQTDVGSARRGRRLVRGVVTLAPHVVVDLVFLAAYTAGDFDKAEGSRPGVLDAATKIGRWLVVDLLPSFIGGPVVWRPGNGPYSFASSPLVLVVAAALLAALLGVVATRTRGSLRACAPVAFVAAAYAVPVLALVYVGRLAQVDDITASDDLRLLPDVSAAVAIGLAALVGCRARPPSPEGAGRVERANPSRGRDRSRDSGRPQHRDVGRLRGAVARHARTGVPRSPAIRRRDHDVGGAAVDGPGGDHARLGRSRIHDRAVGAPGQP